MPPKAPSRTSTSTSTSTRARDRPWPSRCEALLAVGLCTADTVVFSGALAKGLSAGVFLFIVAGFVPIAWASRAPRTVLVLVAVHVLATGILRPDYAPALNVLAALYSVAAHRPARESAAGAALIYIPWAAITARYELGSDGDLGAAPEASLSALLAVVAGAAWALGRWAQRSRHHIESLEHRRARATIEAAAEERCRLARELHDIVSHSVSVMVLQAAGARRVLHRDPDRAEAALAHIEAVGKQSMSELRRMLGVLEDGAPADIGADEPQVTQSGLADLPALIDSFRAGGMQIQEEIRGTPVPLDGSVDLSAFRILQESLTNAAKHAGPAAVVRVHQVWAPGVLLLEVTDDGRSEAGDPALSTGHGLAGLRERARAVGGHLEAAPLPARGFRLSATLPVTQTMAPPAPSHGQTT